MHIAWNINTAVYSSLCTLPTIQMYTGIFVYSVSSHLEWGLLAFSNFNQWDPSKNQTVCHFCRVCQSTHFARSRYAILYSSLCTLVHGQTCGWLTLDKPTGDLRSLLFWPMRAEQYNLHEPHRPITGLEKGQDNRQQTTESVTLWQPSVLRTAAVKMWFVYHVNIPYTLCQ